MRWDYHGNPVEAEDGIPVAQIYRGHDRSDVSFYKWRAKVSGMNASIISQMKSMQDKWD